MPGQQQPGPLWGPARPQRPVVAQQQSGWKRWGVVLVVLAWMLYAAAVAMKIMGWELPEGDGDRPPERWEQPYRDPPQPPTVDPFWPRPPNR